MIAKTKKCIFGFKITTKMKNKNFKRIIIRLDGKAH